jgi:hypothetical protein
MRYANDIALTGLARQITNDVADLNACLRDGHLDTAFKFALLLQDRTERLQERLNDIKYGRASEIGSG